MNPQFLHVGALERAQILEALTRNKGLRRKTAIELGLTVDRLRHLLKRFREEGFHVMESTWTPDPHGFDKCNELKRQRKREREGK